MRINTNISSLGAQAAQNTNKSIANSLEKIKYRFKNQKASDDFWSCLLQINLELKLHLWIKQYFKW